MKLILSYSIEPMVLNEDCGAFCIINETLPEIQKEVMDFVDKVIQRVNTICLEERNNEQG